MKATDTWGSTQNARRVVKHAAFKARKAGFTEIAEWFRRDERGVWGDFADKLLQGYPDLGRATLADHLLVQAMDAATRRS